MQNLIEIDKQAFFKLNSIIGHNSAIDFIVNSIAIYTVYLVPVFMLYFWFASSEKIKKNLLTFFFSAIISWQVIGAYLGKWINRPRPFDYSGVKEIAFHLPSYSFPSDHALFLAFTTTYMYLLGYKKIANISFAATILVSLSRVTGGLHWPSDIIAGWIFGIILAYLFYSLRNIIEKYFSTPLLWVAKKIRLA